MRAESPSESGIANSSDIVIRVITAAKNSQIMVTAVNALPGSYSQLRLKSRNPRSWMSPLRIPASGR